LRPPLQKSIKPQRPALWRNISNSLPGVNGKPSPLREHGALRTDDLQAEGGMDREMDGSRVWEGDSWA
jgi:hypothetical protein